MQGEAKNRLSSNKNRLKIQRKRRAGSKSAGSQTTDYEAGQERGNLELQEGSLCHAACREDKRGGNQVQPFSTGKFWRHSREERNGQPLDKRSEKAEKYMVKKGGVKSISADPIRQRRDIKTKAQPPGQTKWGKMTLLFPAPT